MTYIRFIAILLVCAFFGACNDEQKIDAILIDKQGSPALWKITQKPNRGNESNRNNESIKNISDEVSDKENKIPIKSDDPSQETNNHSLKKPLTIYLFGTIHLLPEGAQWQNSILNDIISQSDRLIIETTGLEDTARVGEIFKSTATDEKTPDLISRIAPIHKDKLSQVVDNSKIPMAALDRFETWAAALTLANSMTSTMGLKTGLGVENILATQFKDAQKPIEGLETIRDQFALFDQLPESDQQAMLNVIIEGADNSKSDFSNLLNAWLDADLDALLDASNTGFLEAPVIREALLDGRNRHWAKILSAKFQVSRLESEQFFVAVGAAHLVGENGVPDLMRKAGFEVKRVQ